MRLLLALIFLWQTAPAPACSDAPACRAAAEAAAAHADYEAFHDLAWRAVQKGRPNDPDLMFLLARAQSLSGRPDDALVMLGRMLDQGFTPDVAANPDFARVRLLKGWPELAARLGAPDSSPAAASAAAPSAPAPSEAVPSAPAPSAPAPSALVAPSAPAAPPSSPAPADSLEFSPIDVAPVGLARDAVSRRFVIGDRKGARLLIVDEMSHHVVTYVSAASAGFFADLTGFAIDARRGDLWVVSAKGDAGASTSVLHKLQLVSGRTLFQVAAPDGDVKLAGVTVTPDGTVYAIDAAGSRLFRVHPGARALESVMKLDAHHLTAVTAVDDRVVYVAGDEGLLRVDVASRTSAPVRTLEKLTGFESLEWHNGSLVGVERVADSYLVVRVHLDASGTRAQPRAILAASTDPIAGGVAGSAFYYLAGRHSIAHVALK